MIGDKNVTNDQKQFNGSKVPEKYLEALVT